MALPDDFTDRVKAVLLSTRPGDVVSYGELAADAGFPRQARAIGRVLALAEDGELPWWRVVRADGSITEAAPDEQTALLRSEGVEVRSGRVVSRRSALPRRRPSPARR
jgi:methylated-DNA-protein-cysteine methyltransferase related protein